MFVYYCCLYIVIQYLYVYVILDNIILLLHYLYIYILFTALRPAAYQLLKPTTRMAFSPMNRVHRVVERVRCLQRCQQSTGLRGAVWGTSGRSA